MDKTLGELISAYQSTLIQYLADESPSIFHSGIVFQLKRVIADLKALNESINPEMKVFVCQVCYEAECRCDKVTPPETPISSS